MRIVAILILAAVSSGCTAVKAGASPVASAPATVRAAAPEATRVPTSDLRALEASLRTLLLKNLPDPLVKSEQKWGQQKPALVRKNEMRNDGTWRRFTVKAANPWQTLGLGLEDAVVPEPGKAAFTAKIGIDCDLTFEQQIWKNGMRLYSGETRGRCRAAVLLKCEATSRTETKPGSFVPDLVFRVKVTEAQLFYEDLVIEHTAGVGGDAAKILGDAVLDAVKQAKPKLEHDLLNKANAAIVKAADTKDVRLSFDSFLKSGPANR
jgi:hypothetical protein